MKTITIAMVGSGGTGVVALGDMLLQLAAGKGLFGIMRKTFSPQIRGGESASIVRLSAEPVASFDGCIDLLLILDWNNFQRFSDEIVITENTLVVQDAQAGQAPELDALNSPLQVDFSGMADSLGSSYANAAALGYLSAWMQLDSARLLSVLSQRLHLSEQDAEVVYQVAQQGSKAYANSPLSLTPLTNTQSHDSYWLATGNQMAGLGALEAGVRFVAAYPITPASDALEWIAGRIEQIGGHLVQAEDELAAVNMAIGASYGGVPAFTATSGPGLALMSESMGLAVASETPLVILDVMRGGPSTGIPTKSEQSDFNLALYGLHGDAPHIVLSPLSIPDCCNTVAWAVRLASELQTLVVVLSDQFLGQSAQIFPPIAETQHQAHLLKADLSTANEGEDGFNRYIDTESGVSPMALPGQAGGEYTADGLEHTENAIPSPRVQDHSKQLDKRLRKLRNHQYGDQWCATKPACEGSAGCLLLCWGSLYESACEAQQLLQERGHSVDVMGVRLLSPLPLEELNKQLKQYSSVVVVEQNHQGQFFHYLRSLGLETNALHCFAQPGPGLLSPTTMANKCEEVMVNEA